MDNFKEDSGKNSSVCVEDTIPRKSVASYLQAQDAVETLTEFF